MSRNASSAVMQQRKEPHDSLDFFPTPPWATRALCQHVLWRLVGPSHFGTVLEPACGMGHMAKALAEYADKVIAADIHDFGYGAVDDFLFPNQPWINIDWIITNPPFRLAQDFILEGLNIACDGVAMLVRTSFLEGRERYRSLFNRRPPTVVAQFVERVPMVKGRLDKKASSATSYCWMVWVKAVPPKPFLWIPPCRKELEREGDYE